MSSAAVHGGQRGVRAVVLAAGEGRRFGGDKQLALLDGRPLLQHVLDVLAGAGIEDPVVVLGANERLIRPGIEWRAAEIVVNPAPKTGLAGSLRLGWLAAIGTAEPGAAPEPGAAAEPATEVRPVDAVLVVLADQPRLRLAVVRQLIAADLDPDRPIVAPRYAGGGGRNPVRIERSAAGLLESVEGDRGLGPLIEAHPELVRSIDIEGTNPDVDSQADLRTLAAAPPDVP